MRAIFFSIFRRHWPLAVSVCRHTCIIYCACLSFTDFFPLVSISSYPFTAYRDRHADQCETFHNNHSNHWRTIDNRELCIKRHGNELWLMTSELLGVYRTIYGSSSLGFYRTSSVGIPKAQYYAPDLTTATIIFRYSWFEWDRIKRKWNVSVKL